ncbi:MAG: hypothetical protein R3Y64_09360 [Peptostreptococcaceae bacterium]
MKDFFVIIIIFLFSFLIISKVNQYKVDYKDNVDEWSVHYYNA